MQVVADRLSLRWYLGYDLREPLPDHSSLSRIRERYGLDCFRRFFEAIVEPCIAAGLVWGRELSFDATKVEANASLDSVGPRFAVEAHLGTLFTATEDATTDDSEERVDAESPALLPVDLTAEAQAALADAAARRHDWIGAAGRPNRTVVRGDHQRVADFRASVTDPDASLMRFRGGGLDLGYHDHYVVDGGKVQIILAALVIPAEVMENLPMLDLLWRVCFRWKLRPRQVTGDTTYGTTENIVAVEDAGIRADVPLPDCDPRTRFFGRDRCTDAPRRDVSRALAATHCGSARTNPPSARGSIRPRLPPATPVCSSPHAPPAPKDGKSRAVATRRSWSGVVPPTPPTRLPRPGANARSGWNRCLRRERPGPVAPASACAAWRRST